MNDRTEWEATQLRGRVSSFSVVELIEEVANEREENAERLRQVAALNVQLLQLESKIYDLNHTINRYNTNGPKALIALAELTK